MLVEKGALRDDDVTIKNVSYDPPTASPRESVHSMKLTFDDVEESDEDSDEEEEEGAKEDEGKKPLDVCEETRL